MNTEPTNDPERPIDPQEAYETGKRFREGNGCEKDAARAIKYWTLAADLGHSVAQFSLGYMYENGIGIDRDTSKAFSFYLLASNSGNSDAMNNLGRCHKLGIGTARSSRDAARMYQEAANHESPSGMINLAMMKLKTEGTDEDETGAFELLRRASTLGLRESSTGNHFRNIALAVAREDFSNKDLFNPEVLNKKPFEHSKFESLYHWLFHLGVGTKLPFSAFSSNKVSSSMSHRDDPILLAARIGTLNQFPSGYITATLLLQCQTPKSSALHIAASVSNFAGLDTTILTRQDLLAKDREGRTVADIAEKYYNTQCLPSSLRFLSLTRASHELERVFSSDFEQSEAIWRKELIEVINEQKFQEIRMRFIWSVACKRSFGGFDTNFLNMRDLLHEIENGESVADVVYRHGNTEFLPIELRWLSRDRALHELKRLLNVKFEFAASFRRERVSDLVSEDEFNDLRRKFVREWVGDDPDWCLDDEQADAVAELGLHIQVTARAGSGKTRTLVARAIFQITHCRIPASDILILAFNKKAVEEIRDRLGKFLNEEQMPHVLTFHALAYRIVRPSEDLIFDEGETKESQVFSKIIQRIIDEGMRSGHLESALRSLMKERWECDLNRIVGMGFDLTQDEFLEFRAMMPSKTMDGRRVPSEAHKHVANALLRLRVRYSHRRRLHRYAGEAYAPDFSHYNKDTEQGLVFEILDECTDAPNPARQAYWKSDRAAAVQLVQLREDVCVDAETTLQLVAKELAVRGMGVSPMNDDELWLALRDDVIRDFTKAVRGFISRCQKELVSPERLDQKVSDAKVEMEVQIRFWRLAGRIYQRYQQILAEEHQTDFDQLMLDAAGLIRDGHTGFISSRGNGDICEVRHLLIDEFQDFSHLFNELRKSILTQSPDANFFCVGDDWQAINKFAGSDLRYFTEFAQVFEPAVRKLISRNYRSSRKIVEIGNQVMVGQGEPSIPNSTEQGNTWRVVADGLLDYTEAEEIVVEELGDESAVILRIVSDCASRGEKVAILSRTRSVDTPEGRLNLERWQARLRSFLPEKERELLETSTTHGYKGKEADVVILLDPEGYPSMHPDSIFSFIFGDTLQSIEEDEKRLFYVGVTRAKKTLFLLSCPLRYTDLRPSFIKFLKTGNPPAFDLGRLRSSLLCGGRVVVRLSNLAQTFRSGGTYPLKDSLKALGYKWNEENKAWSMYLGEGSISSPFECRQFLMGQAWIRDADGVMASFAWEDQRHNMKIVRGSVVPDGTPAQVAEQGRLENAKPAFVTKESDENITPPAHQPSALNPAVHPPTPEATPTGVFETNVVGMRHGGGMEKAKHLSTGDFVKLEREPQNTHDRNAIQVMTSEGARIGYVSAKVAAHLARGLDAWGGTSQAKVTSVWKQPPPNFLVSVQICFPLPPNVAIPRELDANAQLEDNPFAVARPPVRATSHPIKSVEAETVGDESGEITPRQTSAELLEEPQSPGEPLPSFSGSLTKAQEEDLEGLLDPSLGSIITTLYLSGCCLWPEIPYEALDPRGICTGSMLEVAWPDSKIGIALASNDVDSFITSGWTILPAATVSVTELRDLLSAADGLAAPSGMTHPGKALSPTSTKIPADNPGTTENHHLYRKGPFMDDDADDDIPF